MSRRVCWESRFKVFLLQFLSPFADKGKRLLSQPTVKLQIVVSLRRLAEGTQNDPLW